MLKLALLMSKKTLLLAFTLMRRLRGGHVGNQHRCAAVVGRSRHEQRRERVASIRAQENVHRAAIDAIAIWFLPHPTSQAAGCCPPPCLLHWELAPRNGPALAVTVIVLRSSLKPSATCTVVSDGALEIQSTAVGWQMFSDGRGVVDQVLGARQGACRRACGRKGPENRLVSRRVGQGCCRRRPWHGPKSYSSQL